MDRIDTPLNGAHEAHRFGAQLSAVMRNPDGEALGRARVFNAQRDVAQLLTEEPDLTVADAYRRVLDEKIGPRFVGTVYINDAGMFEVIGVHFGADARDYLSYSEWAVTIYNRVTGKTEVVCEQWNARDRIVSQPAEALAGVTV